MRQIEARSCVQKQRWLQGWFSQPSPRVVRRSRSNERRTIQLPSRSVPNRVPHVQIAIQNWKFILLDLTVGTIETIRRSELNRDLSEDDKDLGDGYNPQPLGYQKWRMKIEMRISPFVHHSRHHPHRIDYQRCTALYCAELLWPVSIVALRRERVEGTFFAFTDIESSMKRMMVIMNTLSCLEMHKLSSLNLCSTLIPPAFLDARRAKPSRPRNPLVRLTARRTSFSSLLLCFFFLVFEVSLCPRAASFTRHVGHWSTTPVAFLLSAVKLCDRRFT